MERLTLITHPGKDYELLDSGREEKLERYGSVVLSRPDPQALWEKRLSMTEWEKADARFVRQGREGQWTVKPTVPKEWEITFGGLTLIIKPTSFKHTGLFPEQEQNWVWIKEAISATKRAVSVLNLFGYTGGATLAAAVAGASVTHVDASKTALAWARENAARSGLEDKPIRWIVEDVLVFVKREIKRGNRYDLIVMDPPAFGHGPHDELWKIEEHLLELMKLCRELLTPEPLGIEMSGYAAGYSPLAFAYNLEPFVKEYGGALQYGDLTIEESLPAGRQGEVPQLLPCGIFARWRV
jgi:23S rRNA (cytosine1962-C5)-methyltransferase